MERLSAAAVCALSHLLLRNQTTYLCNGASQKQYGTISVLCLTKLLNFNSIRAIIRSPMPAKNQVQQLRFAAVCFALWHIWIARNIVKFKDEKWCCVSTMSMIHALLASIAFLTKGR